MKKQAALALFLSLMVPLTSIHCFALASAGNASLSPVKAALETIVSPFATVGVGSVASSNNNEAANRDIIMQNVANDAAAHANLDGDVTPLLGEAHSILREELKNRGDSTEYTDKQLSQMILNELGQ